MAYPNISGGDDHRREAFEAMCLATYADAGGTLKYPDDVRDFRGETWLAKARRCLEWAGVPPRTTPVAEMVLRSWDEGVRSGAGSGTLPGLTANVFSLAVGTAYRNTQNVARRLCRMIPLPDHRRAHHAAFDGLPTLTLVSEGASALTPAISDRTEYLQPRAYGANVPFSRESALAGRIGELVRVAELAAKAARNTEDDLLVDLLLQNSQTGPVLNADGLALFHSSHANLVTSGAAPGIATLAVGMAAMRSQTDAGNVRTQNIAPKFLLCPAALEATSRVLVASLYNAAAGDTLEVIPAARLDSTNPAGWYLAADPNMADTFGLGFVGDGKEPEPFVFAPSGMGWAQDSITFKIRHDIGVSALDYRGLFYNDGA